MLNNKFKRHLSVYDSENKKTVRTNIDGFFTCKVPKLKDFEVNEVVEIKGEPEIYKVRRVVSELPNNPSYEYYNKRHYDEVIDFSIVKCLNLTELTREAEQENCLLNDIDFNENQFKENYEFNGVSFKFDGRLNKNQIVRMGEEVITITDLIKPKIKGGLTTVLGTPLQREVIENVYGVYLKNEDNTLTLLSEYKNWGDALLFSSRFNEKTGDRSFL